MPRCLTTSASSFASASMSATSSSTATTSSATASTSRRGCRRWRAGRNLRQPRVRDQVHDKLSFAFEDLGPQEGQEHRAAGRGLPGGIRDRGATNAKPRSQALPTPDANTRVAVGRAQAFSRSVSPALRCGRYCISGRRHPRRRHHRCRLPSSPSRRREVALPRNSSPTRSRGTLRLHLDAALAGRTWSSMASLCRIGARRSMRVPPVGNSMSGTWPRGRSVVRASQIVVTARLVDTGNGTQAWSNDVKIEQSRLAQEPAALISRVAVRLREALWSAEQPAPTKRQARRKRRGSCAARPIRLGGPR